MIIFNPNDETHTVTFIPREYVTFCKMEFRYELRDQKVSIDLNCTRENGYLVATFDYEMKEGQSFEMEMKDGSNKTIYRGKAYCTATPKQQ